MFSALGFKTIGDNLYFLFLIIFSFFSFLFVLACGSCLRCFKDNRDNRDNFFLPLFFFSFLLFFFLLPLSFIISLFLSLFCVLPKAKQLEDGGGYGGEHAGGKGESEIDTVAIIALKGA